MHTQSTINQARVVQTLARRGFRLEQKLGEGGFGAVHKGMCDQYSRPVAIKVIEFGKDNEGKVKSSEREEFELEVRALGEAKGSEYVVDLKTAFTVTDGEKGIIVMELGDGMDLDKYVAKKTIKSKKEVMWIGMGIARGIADLHALDLVHRDLKGGNVILFKGDDGKFSQVKIVDFGMAAKEGENQWVGGTLHYMSDDRVQDYHSNEAVAPVNKADDIFAFGCIMMELLGGSQEFMEWNTIRKAFRNSGQNRPYNNPLVFPKRIRNKHSKIMIDTLQQCLHKDAAARPTAAELEKLFEKKRGQPAPAKKQTKRTANDMGSIAARLTKRRCNSAN